MLSSMVLISSGVSCNSLESSLLAPLKGTSVPYALCLVAAETLLRLSSESLLAKALKTLRSVFPAVPNGDFIHADQTRRDKRSG